jgi:hypothetical protein
VCLALAPQQSSPLQHPSNQNQEHLRYQQRVGQLQLLHLLVRLPQLYLWWPLGDQKPQPSLNIHQGTPRLGMARYLNSLNQQFFDLHRNQ